jgi:hypothetical protein
MNLRENRFLKYCYKCLKGLANPDFQDKVNHIGNEGFDTLHVNHFAYMPKGKPVYYVQYFSDTFGVNGFFALLKRTIEAIAYADYWGFRPYVVYDAAHCLYGEDHEVLGTRNPFEYYFMQITPGITWEEIQKKPYVSEKYKDRLFIYEGIRDFAVLKSEKAETKAARTAALYNIGFSDEYIGRSAEVVKKYLRFNDYTENYLTGERQKLLKGKKTLGVHARGGDWRKGVAGHPVAITLEEHIEQVKKAVAEYGFEQIFLATDEKDAIEAFQKEFGEKVVFYPDTFRAESGENLPFMQSRRENHKYRMGLEVLRDAETLVHCDGFLAGLSNVGCYVLVKKKALGEAFCCLCIEDHGLNRTGLSLKEARKLGDQYSTRSAK